VFQNYSSTGAVVAQAYKPGEIKRFLIYVSPLREAPAAERPIGA
jgi:hypothetical protein